MVSESAFSFKQVGSGEVGMWEAAVNQGLEHMQAEKGDALREGAVKLKKNQFSFPDPAFSFFSSYAFLQLYLAWRK